jgi:hypothetical protein
VNVNVTEAQWNLPHEWEMVENTVTQTDVRGGCVTIREGHYYTKDLCADADKGNFGAENCKDTTLWIGMQWKCQNTPCIDVPQPQSLEEVIKARYNFYQNTLGADFLTSG